MFRNIPFNFKGNAERGREVLERVLDLAMESPIHPMSRVSGAFSDFRVDVVDLGSSYEIFAELPGFTKEEITVSYSEDHYLTISAERARSEEELRYVCRERKRGKYERRFFVDDIAPDEVNVSLENGVLHLVLPKELAQGKGKVFDIN